MSESLTVVIPAERGRDWPRERATNLPTGTRYIIAEHDPGEWTEAVNDGVRAAETPLVFLSAPDVWVDQEPDTLAFLADLAWDADVTYGPLVVWENGAPSRMTAQAMFCPNRLYRENYLPSVGCVRRDRFLEAGGMRTGMWDLWVRLHQAGGRFKYVPEAASARDESYVDASVPPTPTRLDATFYYQATPGTAYWRCLLPARHLPGQAVFNLSERQEKNGKLVLPQHEGAAVFQYAGDEAHYLVGRFLQEQGYRLLIEVDDNYVHWFPDVMRRAGWFKYVRDCPPTGGYSVEGHTRTVEMADGVIVTSQHLAKQYRRVNPHVFVCPNQIDPADWRDPVKPDDGVFRIGWFASRSHRSDARIVERALEWASRQPGVEVVLIGVGVTSAGKPWYPFRFRHVPWSNDFGVYRRFLQELDVGLAPVLATPWACSRSDLKALEYAMAGALPIVSDVPPYEGCEVPGIVHCPDAKAFLRAVQWAVVNKDEVRQLAREARDYVLAERTVEANIDLWREAVTP